MATKTTAQPQAKDEKPKVKWTLEADYLQGCSCDYGCPCEFEAPPTQGFCEGIGAWKIIRGKFGNVSLDGLGLAFFGRSPKAMHLGNLSMGFAIDSRATPEQRAALLSIGKGEHGGLPFEVFPALVTKWIDPVYVPFEFTLNGSDSKVKVGNQLTIALEPIKNPVTGEPEDIKVNHATGFIFKDAVVLSTKECRSDHKGLKISWPGKAGFVSRIKYSN